MPRTLLTGLLAFCIGACTTGEAKEVVDRDDADAAVIAVGENSSSFTRTLPSGTLVNATILERLSSRRAGDVFRAKLGTAITDSRGNIVIAAGTIVLLSIEKVAADSTRQRPEGRISLLVTTVNKSGVSYSLYGTLDTRPGERDASNAVMVAAGTPIVITLTRALNYER